jgi:hypothetical protein
MIKELLKVEFRRYSPTLFKKNIKEQPKTNIKETIVIGIFDTFEEAVDNGNKVLEKLKELGFDVRENDRFHLDRFPSRLVSNCAYNDEIYYFAEITTLNFTSVEETLAAIRKENIG